MNVAHPLALLFSDAVNAFNLSNSLYTLYMLVFTVYSCETSLTRFRV